ncbi:MAG TPA: TVP38/TMEM64 family protein [Alphaproteobacteria bacterium]|nr:TVP38/TMEM64 family protein [Alphaproteobacteria bacterium]
MEGRGAAPGAGAWRRWATPGRLAALGLLIALAAVLAWLWWAGRLEALTFTVAELDAFLQRFGPWSAAASVALMVAHSFLPFPAEVIAVANGMLFGVVVGIAVTWGGAMLGACLAFWLARQLGQPFVRRLVGPRNWRRLNAWSADQGALALLMARLIPVISFNLINYAAGLAGVSWWVFLWTTGIGILPLTVVSVVIGDRMLATSWEVWAVVAASALPLWLIARRLRHRSRR